MGENLFRSKIVIYQWNGGFWSISQKYESFQLWSKKLTLDFNSLVYHQIAIDMNVLVNDCIFRLSFFRYLDLNFPILERHQKMQLTCRFYKNRLPETDDLVMVNVVNIEEMGVYVNLLEYNNIEGDWWNILMMWTTCTLSLGMILLTELSRRRIRSINKLIRVGRHEVVVVVRVDRDKGKWLEICPSLVDQRLHATTFRLHRFIQTSSVTRRYQ